MKFGILRRSILEQKLDNVPPNFDVASQELSSIHDHHLLYAC